MAKIGYARASLTQDYAAQEEALRTVGCEKIFSEKRTAKLTVRRRQFNRLMGTLLPGDCLYVIKLDHMASSTRNLQKILHELHGKGCDFVSLGESWCNTTTENGWLVLTIMIGITRFERGLVRARCQEGIDRAKARGRVLGRKPVIDTAERHRLVYRYATGESMAELAEDYGVSVPTLWRAMHR
jgi:DNA invertase Pin-like site-specific DNA recombinase